MDTAAVAQPIVQHRVELAEGQTLNVRERAGNGCPFLCVHGLASNARLWDHVGAELSAAGHRVVAVDQRGHGLSDRNGGGYTCPQMAADLVALRDALGLDRPVLVGQSWGGNVVMHAGALYPEAWHAIAAVDGGTIRLGQEFADPATAWAALRPPPLAGQPAETVRRMIASSVAEWPDGALEAQMGNFEELADGTARPRLTLEDHRRIVEEMVSNDPAQVYGDIGVPVLLLPVRGGQGSWADRKEARVQEALAALPDGRVQWFDGAHDIHLQKPAVVAAALLTLV